MGDQAEDDGEAPRAKLHEIWLWCNEHRHEPMEWQRERLASRLSENYNYFSIPCNHESLNRVYRGVQESCATG